MVKPVLQALLVADHIYEDKSTNKKVICGTFTTLSARRSPATDGEEGGQKTQHSETSVSGYQRTGSPWAYVCLTSCMGHYECVLRYVCLGDDVPVFEGKVQFEAKDKLQVVEIVVPLPPLNFRKFGAHALELLWEGEMLGSWRINVEECKNGDDRP